MLKPDLAKWQQTVVDLFDLAIHAPHPRTRERFLALYQLAVVGGGATAHALHTGRDRITVMDWVRKYNAEGPAALNYRRTGGSRPLFRLSNASN
jgi:hypothetical protein